MQNTYKCLVAFLKSIPADSNNSTQSVLTEFFKNLTNPLPAQGITLKTNNLAAPSEGSASVGQGQTVELGGAYIGQRIVVTVQQMSDGVCTVVIQAWMPLAQLPIGSWSIGGPGTQTIMLAANFPGSTEPQDGSLCDVMVFGQGGSLPANVVFNSQ